LLGDLEVAGEGERGADAGREAVERGDHRERRVDQRMDEAVGRLEDAAVRHARPHDGTGAERPALARQHRDPDPVDVLERVTHRLEHLGGDRVQAVGGGQSDAQDAVLALDPHVVGHRFLHCPSRVCSTAISAVGWSSMMWCPESGITVTGTLPPRRERMSSVMSEVDMPRSPRISATSQAQRATSSGCMADLRNTRGSNFQVHPASPVADSEASTRRIEPRAMWSRTYGADT